ncbi:MAG: hypothetical protein EXR64_00480 [Dehalococcoidia bacterium]|nr:hypothetical protein [Dehalococcoidia bacterium]
MDWVQTAILAAGLASFGFAFLTLRSAAAKDREDQLKTGGHEPVAMAQSLNSLQVAQRRGGAGWMRGPDLITKIREMHLDLADVVSESRRTAGQVLDYAGRETYFRDLLTEDGYAESLAEAEGWYTDHMFALFGRLYVRDPQSLVPPRRIVVSRPDDKAWPSSLGRWTFHSVGKKWNLDPDPFAAVWIGLRSRGTGEVCLHWRERDSSTSCPHGSESKPDRTGYTHCWFRRTARLWMDDGESSRFQLPLYRVVRFGLPRYPARR